MANKNNMAVREAAEKHHLYMYEVAFIMGISEPTLCRKMRYEWPKEEQKRVIALIKAYGGKK